MNKIIPFSSEVIFIDTEFTTLNPYHGELLSIGLIKLSGEELYIEIQLDEKAFIEPWVKENVLPLMKQEKLSKQDARKKINEFVGDEKPFLISYVTPLDISYLFKLYANDSLPFDWMAVDFSSILFSYGINPHVIRVRDKQFFADLGVDHEKYNQHKALDEAKLLRDIYLKIAESR